MTESTPVMDTDLDLLAERVEKAAALVQRLREENQGLRREREELGRRLADFEARLQGQDVAALLAENQGLKKEQREWQAQRRDVATRIEALARKLERLEG
jgi:predicted RNase H-like nuclease (RuvC/YqgF family)